MMRGIVLESDVVLEPEFVELLAGQLIVVVAVLELEHQVLVETEMRREGDDGVLAVRGGVIAVCVIFRIDLEPVADRNAYGRVEGIGLAQIAPVFGSMEEAL